MQDRRFVFLDSEPRLATWPALRSTRPATADDRAVPMDRSAHTPTHQPAWEEATETRPMRSPFGSTEGWPERHEGISALARPPEAVDVTLEEEALFAEPPLPTWIDLPRVSESAVAPPPIRTDDDSERFGSSRPSTRPPRARASLPPPRFDEEATAKRSVPLDVLRSLREELAAANAQRDAAFEEPSWFGTAEVAPASTVDDECSISDVRMTAPSLDHLDDPADHDRSAGDEDTIDVSDEVFVVGNALVVGPPRPRRLR
jgi:hypothetical protein